MRLSTKQTPVRETLKAQKTVEERIAALEAAVAKNAGDISQVKSGIAVAKA